MSVLPSSDVEKFAPTFSLRALALYFLKLGAIGFGGPIPLCGYMHRDLVESRKWFTPQEYSEGFALSQMAPGPLATQLAMYFGWLRGRALGATVIGICFVLPSFLMVVVMAEIYRRYQDLSWIQACFFGIGAAVIAVMIKSVSKLVRKTILHDRVFFLIGFINLAAVISLRQPSVLLFIASGLAIILVKAPPGKISLQAGLVFAPPLQFISQMLPIFEANTLKIFFYFLKAGAFVFGTGLAIIPFLHGAVVDQFHWLTEKQFLDAVSVALITPGPAVITVAFIGYLVSGLSGAVAASAGVFLPVYIFVLVFSPLYRRIVHQLQVRAFVDGVTAAAVGSLVGAIFILARSSIMDYRSLAVFTVTVVCLWKLKVPEPILILAAGLVGFLIA